MASPKAKPSIKDGSGGRLGQDRSMAFFPATGAGALPKGMSGFKIKVPDSATKILSTSRSACRHCCSNTVRRFPEVEPPADV